MWCNRGRPFGEGQQFLINKWHLFCSSLKRLLFVILSCNQVCIEFEFGAGHGPGRRPRWQMSRRLRRWCYCAQLLQLHDCDSPQFAAGWDGRNKWECCKGCKALMRTTGPKCRRQVGACNGCPNSHARIQSSGQHQRPIQPTDKCSKQSICSSKRYYYNKE